MASLTDHRVAMAEIEDFHREIMTTEEDHRHQLMRDRHRAGGKTDREDHRQRTVIISHHDQQICHNAQTSHLAVHHQRQAEAEGVQSIHISHPTLPQTQTTDHHRETATNAADAAVAKTHIVIKIGQRTVILMLLETVETEKDLLIAILTLLVIRDRRQEVILTVIEIAQAITEGHVVGVRSGMMRDASGCRIGRGIFIAGSGRVFC